MFKRNSFKTTKMNNLKLFNIYLILISIISFNYFYNINIHTSDNQDSFKSIQYVDASIEDKILEQLKSNINNKLQFKNTDLIIPLKNIFKINNHHLKLLSIYSKFHLYIMNSSFRC